MSSRRQTIVFAALAAALMPFAAIGQNDPPPAYRPGLGDLMTMTVQPRHLKVGLALEQRNWAYAAFEVRAADRRLQCLPPERQARDDRDPDAQGRWTLRQPGFPAGAALSF